LHLKRHALSQTNAEEQTWALVLAPKNGDYDVEDMRQVVPTGGGRPIVAGGVQDIPGGTNDAELNKVVAYAVEQYRALHGANAVAGTARIVHAQRQVVSGIKYLVCVRDVRLHYNVGDRVKA
jgi:hypothetical protein